MAIPESDSRKQKAYGFFGTLDYIEKNYDEATKKRILGQLSPDTRDFVETGRKAVFAPPRYMSELWRGIVKEHPDQTKARQELFNAGMHLGAYATNTYLKLLLRMLPLNTFAKKFPDIWARDTDFGKVVIDNSKADSGHLTMTLTEIGNYPYFIPVAEGWFSFSFGCMGLKDLKVESDWTFDRVDTDRAVYRFTWTK